MSESPHGPPPADPPDERRFRRSDLLRGDGTGGRPAYIAHAGVVYDVSDCPKWRTGFHEQLHFAGQDLTGELADAPHSLEVFDRPCVKRVGILVEEADPRDRTR